MIEFWRWFVALIWVEIYIIWLYISLKSLDFNYLKGRCSRWDRGSALASALNYDFQLETTIRNDSLYFSFDVFKVYLSNIDSKTAEM